MLVLFAKAPPDPLRPYLKAHSVTEARERGWDRLTNGDLLKAAEASGFEVVVTADKNLRYPRNLASRKIAIVVIGNAQWRVLKNHTDLVVSRWMQQHPAASRK